MSAHTPHELHEEFPKDAHTISWLKRSNGHFCKLADRYHALNRSIHRIEVEVEPTSDAYLTRLRKQRLHLLDEIEMMIEAAEGDVLTAQADQSTGTGLQDLFARVDSAAAIAQDVGKRFVAT